MINWIIFVLLIAHNCLQKRLPNALYSTVLPETDVKKPLILLQTENNLLGQITIPTVFFEFR